MPCVELYGTTLSWSCQGLARDPVVRLLSMLDSKGASPPGRLHIELRAAPRAYREDPRQEGWVPSFYHGVVQAYHGERGFLLWDRASRVQLPPGGAPIEALIADEECEIASGSTAAMLQIALALRLRTEGLFHLHAAAVVHPGGDEVVIVGASGAGKTTTTLALLESGYSYLGDDTLFLERNGPVQAVRVRAFPREFHLGVATLSAFPRLEALAGAARGSKRALDPRVAFPGRFVASLEGRSPLVVLFPVVAAGATTTVAPVARADAFGHLLASSAALVVDGVAQRDENIALLRDLLGGARCYEVRLGRDVLQGPATAIATPIEAILRARAG